LDARQIETEKNMARVRMISPETADAELARVYDAVRAQWGRISNFSQVLAHQPAALQGWMLPNDAIRLKNVKTDPDYVKIQQLVIIKTSALNGSAYCLSHNVPLGKKIGLTEDKIAAAQGSDYMASPALDARPQRPVAGRVESWRRSARPVSPHCQSRPVPFRALPPRDLSRGQRQSFPFSSGEPYCRSFRPTIIAVFWNRDFLLASPGFGLSIHGGFGADASRFTKRSLPSPRAKRLHRWML